jgi:hypothetical protein
VTPHRIPTDRSRSRSHAAGRPPAGGTAEIIPFPVRYRRPIPDATRRLPDMAWRRGHGLVAAALAAIALLGLLL